MDKCKCICYECKNDKIPQGCDTPIDEQVVVKGVGVIDCKRFEGVENNHPIPSNESINNDLINMLADMLFAYVNKSDTDPHLFEIEAVEKASDYLIPNYKGGVYKQEFFKEAKRRVRQL